MMVLVALIVGLARAAVADDLKLAANPDLPLAARQAAWGRMLSPELVKDLVKLANQPEISRNERWVAIRALGPIQDDRAREELLQYLASDDASTRMAALGALGDRGDRQLSGRVAGSLADKALIVRASAADALAHLKDPSTLADLDRALADPTNSYRGASMWVRHRFVAAMAAIGTDAAVPPLARALDDADPLVVDAAVTGLETVAGFSYDQGRTPDEEKEAWRRWAGR